MRVDVGCRVHRVVCVWLAGCRVCVCVHGMLGSSMELHEMTRKHGVKIAPVFSCSVEDCSLAVGKVNNAVVMFVDSIYKSNTVVETGSW